MDYTLQCKFHPCFNFGVVNLQYFHTFDIIDLPPPPPPNYFSICQEPDSLDLFQIAALLTGVFHEFGIY